MNNEETKVLNQNQIEETTVKTSEKKDGKGVNAAFAAGGFAAGAAMGAAGNAIASTPKEEEVLVVETEVQTEMQESSPNPEDVLLATDEGIRVAQVSDEASFGEAFADARAQVGPGGTFEWRGHIYSTYYEEEWSSMSSQERADFQSKINYQDIAGGSTEEYVAEGFVNDSYYDEPAIAANAEMVDNHNDQDSVKVLGVEVVVDEYGNPMTVAAVEAGSEQALLIDVDNNGMMDVIMVDENYDGQISEHEIYDISDAQISSADLHHQIAASQNPDMMFAYNDGMPDYMNDADISSMA